ncbi:AGC/YANK protein kinase [Coprinopsis cinerea okayama7|uniref:AGC/YANK protein kinase n=1 Tax=Coprinopsis cinerea (strain Okayama-7 / 130 / ATCC MYA-4618 / FGSC 9003) TaxID=240176 RepID=A8N9M2_COPC7|nr:AGC/YANK protein kinase [Coprinopsis cinerea okayama7\|eukprot:XP_001831528.2 AGC/YANK protein kinase [Coprinopsis cinerea okayama7\
MGAVCCRPQPIDFDGEVNLFHFVLLRCVGKGAFGKVRVVQHKQTKDLYALKYINKSKCVKMKAVPNVIQERRLLEEASPNPQLPFWTALADRGPDDENCFFVLDLMLGGDLRFHLERLGSMSEDTVRFYVAQLSSALAYLHEMGIMHRDIKPDNILLDERGNAHLTDFNIAVHFGERRLTGVAGSMAYMAPEILTKRGYTCYIDWWSLGVCAYELIFGRRPFRGRTNSDLTYSISKDPLKWPEDAEKKCSRAGMQVLRGFLERDPSKRLGCKPDGEGFQELKRHPWMKPIDWDTLETKEQLPPFTPDQKKANFDASHELEELLLEDNPLKAKARKANQDNLSAEMRQMEEQFTSYDFKKMQRRSYYPHNQHLISTATATSSGLASSRPATPANDLRVDAVTINNGNAQEYQGHEDSIRGEKESIRMERVNTKEYS